MYRYCNEGWHLEIKLVRKEKEKVSSHKPEIIRKVQ
jgi:hypothetical protein